MAITPPAVTQLVLMDQGNRNFPVEALWVDNVHLAANTHKEYDIAAMLTAAGLTDTSVFLVFSADGPFWANFQGANAAIPSADILDGSSSEFAPNQRFIDKNCRKVSMIAAAITNVSIQVYKPG